MISLESISIIVAICSLGIAFAVFVRTKTKDCGNQDATNATVVTKLEFISEDVKDIKAEQRTFQSQINEVRVIAINANSKADIANQRLDRAGIGKYNEGTD